MRINERLREILESERNHKERFNDTILRIIIEKGELAKENYDMKGRTDYLIRVIDDQKRQIDKLKSKGEVKLNSLKLKAKIMQN